MNYDEFNPYTVTEQTDMNKNAGKIKPKKDKNRNGKGKKILTVILCAVLFGCVAGGACYGITYAGLTIFPIESADNGDTHNESNDKLPGNNTSTPTQPVNYDFKTEVNVTVMDVSEMVDNVISSVVAVTGTYIATYHYGLFGSQQYESTVSGSGIIVGDNGEQLFIVTNAHVVEDVDNIKIQLYDGTDIDADVKGTRPSRDLAILTVNKADIPSDAIYTMAKLGESSEVKVGEAAIAVGNSMGYGISVTTGCISALNKTITVEDTEYNNLIQTDAAINPGNSGGALFNASGEVIGINSVKMSQTGVEGMGYAISISSVKEIIDELSLKEQYSEDDRGYLGITGVTISSEISAQYGYPVGVLVRTVAEDSGAYNAGIMKNDIIKSFDGEKITTFDQLYSMMSSYSVGEEIEVAYYRIADNGEYVENVTTVILTAKE